VAVKPKKTTKKKNITRPKKSVSLASVQTLANKYARLRDCFGNDGAGCISCGRWFSYEELDGGHYLPATSHYSSTRFDERNINAQCHRCNRFLHGNLRGYFRGLEKKLGRSGLDDLEAAGHPYKWSQDELRELRSYYNDRITAIGRGEDPRTFPNQGMAMSSLFSNLRETGTLSEA